MSTRWIEELRHRFETTENPETEFYWQSAINWAIQSLDELTFLRRLTPTSRMVARYLDPERRKYSENAEGVCIAQQLWAEKMGWTK